LPNLAAAANTTRGAAAQFLVTTFNSDFSAFFLYICNQSHPEPSSR